MDDKYEVLNKGENDANQATPAVSVSGVSHSGSPAADATPLLDQEADLLKSTTDLNTKKFQSESEQFSLVICFIKMRLLTLTSLFCVKYK